MKRSGSSEVRDGVNEFIRYRTPLPQRFKKIMFDELMCPLYTMSTSGSYSTSSRTTRFKRCIAYETPAALTTSIFRSGKRMRQHILENARERSLCTPRESERTGTTHRKDPQSIRWFYCCEGLVVEYFTLQKRLGSHRSTFLDENRNQPGKATRWILSLDQCRYANDP